MSSYYIKWYLMFSLYSTRFYFETHKHMDVNRISSCYLDPFFLLHLQRSYNLKNTCTTLI